MIRVAILVSLLWPRFAAAAERESQLAPVRVIGSGSQFLARPLTAQKIDKRKMSEQQHTDIHRALKQTTGVYVREEDGLGLRPNIGLRGTNPDRSKKVTLLEDGVLIGPAPFSAPAAYYTPNMNQVESLEIYKGFSALPFGPNSIGGSIQYLTPAVPMQPDYRLQMKIGSFGTQSLKISAGGPMVPGKFGYLLQASHQGSDGFKEIEGGGDAGFSQENVLAKWLWNLPAEGQILLLSVGYGRELSHETYVGLTETDFNLSPYRRYASTKRDLMTWEHRKFQLRHQHVIGEDATLETTAYHHQFDRTWYRLDAFRDTSVNLRDVLRSPEGSNAPYLAILRGEADSSSLGPINGQLILANNDRSYFSQGLQTRYTKSQEGLGIHDLEFFLRVHQDAIERYHVSDRYEMTAGALQQTSDPAQLDTDNRDSARALTLVIQDNWQVNKTWTLTPVLRFERAEFIAKDDLTNETRDREDEVWLPGLALTTLPVLDHSFRLSVNRAATLAGISTDGTERRESATNFEFEWKHANQDEAREASVTAFINDYENLTGTCSASSACSQNLSDRVINGGEARVSGVEAALAKGFYWGAIYFPLQFSLTWLEAEFSSDFQSSSADWGVGRVRSGDPIPYVPKLQYNFNIGTELRAWRQELSVLYQSQVFDQAAAGRREIPAYGILDWVGSYRFSKSNQMTLKVDNLLGRDYISSARPYGLRPGKARSILLGWSYQF